MIIKNARIVSPGGIREANIYATNERITRITKTTNENDEEIIDANGMLVLPGLIDVHVHLRDPGATHKEDFFTGTCAALAGGYTTVLDMPNNNPPTTTVKTLREKEKIAAEKTVCDYDFHFGAEKDNFEEIIKAGPRSLKLFMGSSTGNLLTDKMGDIERHFKNFPEKKPICIHAEDEERITLLKNKYALEDARIHGVIRDELAALVAVEKALNVLEHCPRRIHFCHVTSGKEVQLIRSRKWATVSCEASPHHLFLSEKTIEKLGNYAKVNPPLRSEKTRKELWRELDGVDMIASDHAPHTISEKQKPYAEAPSGVPGLETTLPLLLNAVNEKKLSIERVVEMCCSNPANAFKLKDKGEIAAGKHADFTLVDMKKTHKLTGEKLFTKCGWTPYEGMKVKGRVEKVILRGELAYDAETHLIYAKKGSGKKAE